VPRILKTVSLSLFLAGCATVHVAPFTAVPERTSLGPDQRVLWKSSDEQDDAFRNINADYDDPALQAYIQGIVDRMYPELKGAMQVHLLKSTVPDAFMMANGSCYVQLGLLSLLPDESSLALVLAHEGIHFVHQHAVEERAHAGNVELALGLAVPFFGPALARSSIYGYSVVMETEADQAGYQRYLGAGYPAAAAAAPMIALDKYSQAMEIKENYYYADHPKLQDRIAYFKKASAGVPAGGDTGAARYQAATAKGRLWVLQELLARHDQKALIFLLEDPARAAQSPDAPYYLASAYLFRNGDGDGTRAEDMYRQLIAKDPAFAPSYAALGKQLFKRGDAAGAKPLFETYLQLAPDAPDRAYILFDLQHLTDLPAAAKER
jgi:predicted Zn-dependent protease